MDKSATIQYQRLYLPHPRCQPLIFALIVNIDHFIIALDQQSQHHDNPGKLLPSKSPQDDQ
jgi:hypothetical protein